MSENKKKYAYWMKPSMVEEMTEMLDTANATSKSDFVCQAVNFYIKPLVMFPMMAVIVHKDLALSKGQGCWHKNLINLKP